ncbi:cathepsin L-like proteinase [Pelodytes ibericus]
MRFNKHLFVFSTIVICASAAHFLEQEWHSWKSKYGKKYPTPDKEIFRRKAWEATWDKVEKHNQLADQGLKNYRLEMNHFADMTSEERNSRNCLSLKRKSMPADIPKTYSGKLKNIPKEVDWRKLKCVTPARNQGGFCGSCWAFATVGVIESRYCIEKGELPVLSEQHLVDCDDKSDGCCGGLPVYAMEYITQHGVMRSKDYEYAQKKAECLYDSNEAIRLNVTKYYLLPEEENMASTVALTGPITVGVAAGDDFSLYKEGIYDGGCADSTNHAIIIVGYGTDPSEDDEEEGQDYWIIKNSWGKAWGEEGFAKMKRNVNQCNIAEMAATMDFVFH